jgi:hypothetical protein
MAARESGGECCHHALVDHIMHWGRFTLVEPCPSSLLAAEAVVDANKARG